MLLPIKENLKRLKEKIYKEIAWLLPKELVKWCFCRVTANATTGSYSGVIMSDLRAIDALDRWK